VETILLDRLHVFALVERATRRGRRIVHALPDAQ
jgi:hypothetical protein